MAEVKPKSKARATLKINLDGSLKGGILYKDRNAYLSDQYKDVIEKLCKQGIGALIKDPRVQPGSIAITFNLI